MKQKPYKSKKHIINTLSLRYLFGHAGLHILNYFGGLYD